MTTVIEESLPVYKAEALRLAAGRMATCMGLPTRVQGTASPPPTTADI